MSCLSLRLKAVLSKLLAKLTELLPGLFRRDGQGDPDPSPGQLTQLDRKLGKRIQERQARQAARAQTARIRGFNMPKRQPCPVCHASAKRKLKTFDGANYYCRRCRKTFFLRARV